jgi:hypothetical protein
MKLFTSIIFDIYLTTFNLTGYNSNCFKENIFIYIYIYLYIIESCYRNGNRGENCKWVYSLRLCLNEFLERLALL